MRVRVVLLGGLLLMGLALFVTLSRSPLTVARTSVALAGYEVASTHGNARICQGGEAIPPGVSALRLSVSVATVGPSVGVTLLAGGRVLARGGKDAGWRGGGLTVPLRRVPPTSANATVCVTTGSVREAVSFAGARASASDAAVLDGKRLAGRVTIAYLHPGRNSWLSLGLSVARRMGLGRAAAGSWVAALLGVLMIAVASLASLLVVRELAAGDE
jgi:hypothetical protein